MSRRPHKIPCEYFDGYVGDNVVYAGSIPPSTNQKPPKRSVFTKDNIQCIYENYKDVFNDYSSSTVENNLSTDYVYPYLVNSKRRVKITAPGDRRRCCKQAQQEYLRELDCEYEHYLQSSHNERRGPCEPVYTEMDRNNEYDTQDYIKYHPRYTPDGYYLENPNYVAPVPVKYLTTSKKHVKTLKKIHKRNNMPVYKEQLYDSMTESSICYLLKDRSTKLRETRKSVISCGNQTDFSQQSISISSQTEQIPGKWESLLQFCGLSRYRKDIADSTVTPYSRFIFVAGLTINLVRVYVKMTY